MFMIQSKKLFHTNIFWSIQKTKTTFKHIKWWRQPLHSWKKLGGSRQIGKLSKIALRGDSPLLPSPPWRRPWCRLNNIIVSSYPSPHIGLSVNLQGSLIRNITVLCTVNKLCFVLFTENSNITRMGHRLGIVRFSRCHLNLYRFDKPSHAKQYIKQYMNPTHVFSDLAAPAHNKGASTVMVYAFRCLHDLHDCKITE